MVVLVVVCLPSLLLLEISLTLSCKSGETITTSLKALEVPNQKRPNSYLLNLFFDAKNTEILSLYSEAATLGVDTKTLQTTLEGLDRTHASSYGDLGGK